MTPAISDLNLTTDQARTRLADEQPATQTDRALRKSLGMLASRPR